MYIISYFLSISLPTMRPKRMFVIINSLTPPTKIKDITPATAPNKIEFQDNSVHLH